MTAKVLALQIKPGIQRDGTQLAAPTFVDGQWVRFQNSLPRKIGGYRGIFLNGAGISRGMTMSSTNGLNYVISGYSLGMQQWSTDNDDGVGFGPTNYIMVGYITQLQLSAGGTGYTSGTYAGVALTGGLGTGAVATIVVLGGQVNAITLTSGGTGYGSGDILSASAASIGGTGSGFTALAVQTNYFVNDSNNLWQFDIGYDTTGGNVNNLIAHPGQNLYNIDSTVNTRPLIGPFPATTMSAVGVFLGTGTITSGSASVTFPATNVAIGAGVSVSGTGIPAGTTVKSASLVSSVWTVVLSNNATASSPSAALASVAVTGTAGQFSCTATTNIAIGQTVTVAGTLTGTATGIAAGTYYVIATNTTSTFTLSSKYGGTAITTTAGTTTGLTFNAYATLTFDANVSVSGGVVMLHPYLFVYGNYGLIKNCSAGNFNDWVSADANETSVATGKVVKGLPLRGGTTSPAGLFWTLDSVVRVTYAPSTVNNLNFYWKYDLITSQSSIMSSQCVIEYDGIFYWTGVDRFLMYNGVVQEISNNQNMNYFFDNLNYVQRQKVWCTKVPRWGEIWWFYPKGDATECTDAIIYNVREKTWYDAGEADGARRSAGTFSEVFRQPVWGGWDENSEGTYTLWQHETGVNQIYLNTVNAIDSFFETPALGSYAGLVATTQQPGDNVWTRCERVEPDFVQSEEMYLVVTGKGYADDNDQPSPQYTFQPDTLKVDMREQRREMRMRFGSNIVNGNYYMGKVLLSLDTGDVRGTGNP
jgi:hypothetical protein